MNTHRLTNCISFANNCRLYTPEDPFRIYERLARIFMKIDFLSNEINDIYKRDPFPYTDLLNFYDYTDYNFKNISRPIRFLKWIHQEIPTQFWKFNVFIDINTEHLKDSVLCSKPSEIWVDMPKLNNKTKAVSITSNVIKDLKSKNMYLPGYDHICKTVSSWRSDYKYNFGTVKEPLVKWKGGEYYV